MIEYDNTEAWPWFLSRRDGSVAQVTGRSEKMAECAVQRHFSNDFVFVGTQ